MKNLLYLGFLCAAVALFYLPLHFEELLDEEEEEKSKWLILSDEQLDDAGIAFSQVKTEFIEKTLPVYGKISLIPDCHCHVASKAPGIIKKALKNLGDSVSQGEAIALIESKELADAQAQYQILDAKVSLLRSLYEKEAKLSQKHLATDQEFVQALTELQQAEIEKRMIAEKLHVFGLTPNMPAIYEAKAPFNGTVIKRLVTMGEAVDSGQELYELANLNQVWGEFVVYPHEVHLIDKQKEVIVEDGYGTVSKGSITYISPMIKDDGTIAFIANIENENGKWRPGAQVKGKVIVDSFETEFCVPTDAIVTIDNIPHIFIAHDEGIEPRKVFLGYGNEYYTEIIDGVLDGEKIVASNAALLKCEMTKQAPD